MLFNSFEFFVFLPIVFVLYWFVFNKNLRNQNYLLLVASYFFYGWWSFKFLGLLFLSTLIDYFYGFKVASNDRKKAKTFMLLSVLNNLGILAVFKYYNFFAEQIKLGFDTLGIQIDPILLNVALPVGISFYTFHGMSYVFDIFRGKQRPVKDFGEYAVFVSFFPLLVAGPIERANHLLPQVQSRRFFKLAQAVEGGRMILWGLFKKIVIADNLAGIVNTCFINYAEQNSLMLIIGAVAFGIQIYCDFSGYSDIALGTAKLFGFELLLNFRFPYLSRDLAEFWRRWHISLSSWFRDYLYIPLGGSRLGKLIAVRNTFIIFLVSGFWHGASWNFIFWGLIHALGFLPLLIFNKNRKFVSNVVGENTILPSLKEFMQIVSTFIFVTFAWIFFRAPDLSVALNYIHGIFLFDIPTDISLDAKAIFLTFLIGILILLEWIFRKDMFVLQGLETRVNSSIIRFIIYIVIIFSIPILAPKNINLEFIYFQF